jgi:adenylate cyclase
VRILVAEDNVDSRDLLLEILQTQGHEVILAFDGADALEQIALHKPDLCIVDVDMPRKNGFEVVQNLKGDPATASLPIIMLTARSEVENRVRGMDLGIDDYIAKPFNPRELMARVNKRLSQKAETDDLRQQEELIRNTFSRYVAPEVIQYMLDNPQKIQLGGEVRQVTVFFADLQGFTAMSEREDPVNVLHLLNRYHGLLMEYVKRNGGMVDKFLGDGLMALYNAPIDLDDHLYRAVKSALEARQALASFYEREKLADHLRLQIRFGIHSGTAVVGNVGAEKRMEYTAIGDTVNLAARLQTLGDGDDILISGPVFVAVGGRFKTQELGSRLVKGREEPVQVYRVLDFQ